MATLADVARLAGVSPATASRIVNGSAKLVTEELRARVLRAVEELQYVPNAHAQLPHLASMHTSGSSRPASPTARARKFPTTKARASTVCAIRRTAATHAITTT